MRSCLLLAALLSSAAAPAHAGAVFFATLSAGAGIGAAIGATVVGGWLTSTLGRIVVSVVLSALQARLQKRKAPRSPGIRTKVAGTGGTQPRAFVVGRYATAGGKMAPEMSHGASGGFPNYYLTQVVDVCDIPGPTVARIAIDGEWAPLGTTPHPSFGLPVLGKWTGVAWLKLRTGLETTADAHLLATYGSYPERPWSADMIGRNIVQAILTFGYSAEVFNGIPRVLFEVVNLPLYDARADSTAGGSGAQRWATPSTWAPSENPIVIVENILRGITLPDLGTWGGAIPSIDIRRASFNAAMNVCDQSVPVAAGGSEPRYRAGFEIKVSDEPHEVIDEILKACNGELAEAGGVWIAKAGEPGLPVWFFTDGDLLTDRPEDMDPLPGGDGVINAVTPTFVAPEMVWQGKDGPMFTDAAWEAADGERREAELPLNAVASPSQAQRVTAAYARDARRWRSHKLPLPPDAAVLEPLDVVAWTSQRNGYDAKAFEVREIEDDPETMIQIVTLREVDPADYSWSTAEERPVALPSTSYVAPETVALKDFAVVAASLTDASGTGRRPGLLLSWDGVATTGALGVEYEVRVSATAAVVGSGVLRADTGSGRVDGLLPSTSYQVRARAVTDRPTSWTAWTPVTTGAQRLTADDLAPGSVTLPAFASDLSPPQIVGALPTTGNFDGRVVYLTTDKKLYRFNGTAWTASVAAVDITGQITAPQIADSAVTDAKIAGVAAGKIAGQITTVQIADNAISAPKITAGAVVAGKIAADAVQASNIAAGSVIAGKIAANAVDATAIAADAVTAVKIAANAITAAKIATGAITADKVAAGAITAAALASTTIITSSAQIADALITSAKLAGTIQSDNFAAGVSGWRITKAGDAEFNSLVVRRGNLDAQSTATGVGATNTTTVVSTQNGSLTIVGVAASVLSVSLTTTGGKVHVIGDMAMNRTGSLWCGLLRVTGGVTTFLFEKRLGRTGDDFWGDCTCPYWDDPPAGTHTYHLAVSARGTGGSIEVTERNLSAVEFKQA